ncbi:tRNA (adenosine(37)-N6)-threonylcarbamoyltransferase complex ATPase subunit type 1 TsaE [Consotaella aegiceratis]|uniref:tRNA (adenosine(37)-N6)-threonylcarbamoyltransferase complex ATPase subunit type 1 TsaE n=1 Tax=Consotaella aegiceratis TaxID=3097961 RepID=UPI002F424154
MILPSGHDAPYRELHAAFDGDHLFIPLADESATQNLGRILAGIVAAGEVIALRGDLGAGKSTLARALIRALAADSDLEVPSPTYTLVQSYDTEPPVWHFDLYRLGDPSELAELGFEEAAEDGVVLCEWPERAGIETIASLTILLEATDGNGRRALVSGVSPMIVRLCDALGVNPHAKKS